MEEVYLHFERIKEFLKGTLSDLNLILQKFIGENENADLILVGLLLLFLFFITIRQFHIRKIKKVLFGKLKDCPDLLNQLEGGFQKRSKSHKAGGEIIAPVSLSALDAIFHFSRIDPRVLEAIDSAHGKKAFESYKALSDHVESKAEEGGRHWEGMVNQYKGYFGENLMAGYLGGQGHLVEIPKAPNQEGYDAIVDGQPVQFKSGLNPSAINEHQERFPNIPVFTVQEQGGTFEGNENITALPISGQKIEELTEKSLEGIEGQTSSLGEFPAITGVISGGKNLYRVMKGHMSLGEAIKYTGSDVAGVGMGGMIGGALGTGVGIVGGPPGMMIGEIIGTLIGASIGRGLSGQFKGKKLEKAILEVKELFSQYPQPYLKGLKNKASALKEQARGVRKSRKGFWLWPKFSYVVRGEVAKRYEQWGRNCNQSGKGISTRLKKLKEPNEISDLGQELFTSEEYEVVYSRDLEPLRKKIRILLETIFTERRKLGLGN